MQDPTMDDAPISLSDPGEIPADIAEKTGDKIPDAERQLGTGGGREPTADELAKGEEKVIEAAEKLAKEAEDIEGEPGADHVPEKADPSAADKEWLAELGLGLEDDFDSVEDAIIALHEKASGLEQKMGGADRQALDKLEKIAGQYKVPMDRLLDVLANQLDPGSGAQVGADFAKLNSFLQGSDGSPEEVEFYQNHARALTEDISQIMQGMFARSHNMLYDMILDQGFEMRADKHLRNISDEGERKVASSQMNEAKRVLKEILKDHYGKPNDVDIALKYLGLEKPRPSFNKAVDRKAGEKIKADQARKRRFYTESAGRMPTGTAKLDTQEDMERANPAAIRAKLRKIDNM